jgi:hypothetical protein
MIEGEGARNDEEFLPMADRNKTRRTGKANLEIRRSRTELRANFVAEHLDEWLL